MAISINNLKIFVEVVEHDCNITLTAQKLYISQPAISKAIKNIETELDVMLFNRDKKIGMKLTPIGKKILVHTRLLLHEEEKIYQIAHNENHLMEGKLRIAAIPFHTYSNIGKSIKIFKEKYPNVEIQYHETTTQKVKEMVLQYEVDLGMTIYPFDKFETINLYDDSMIAFSKKNLHIKNLDFKNIKDKIKVCQSGLEVIQPVLEKSGIFDVKQFEVYASPMTVKVLVDEGLGIGIVSKSFLDNLEDYYTYPLVPLISSEAAVIFNSHNDLTPIAKEFLRILIEVNTNN